MKVFTILALVLTTTSVFAAAKGLNESDAQNAVISQAHRYISVNAPDFGGSVHSPCVTQLRGDELSVSCSGIARETTGGDGSASVRFSCLGIFNQGHDGLFYLDGAIQCK